MSLLNVICDDSYKGLDQVPPTTLEMTNLKMLYLEGNQLTTLPHDFFLRLPKLSWLDLRSNQLTSLPASIQFHCYLENILVQNNRIERLPNELGLVPNLKVLQLSGNPIQYPAANIISNGIDDICIYLKQEYDKEHGRLHFSGNAASSDLEPVTIKAKVSVTSSTSSSSQPSVEEVRKQVRRRLAKSRRGQPVLEVKSLSKIHQEQQTGDQHQQPSGHKRQPPKPQQRDNHQQTPERTQIDSSTDPEKDNTQQSQPNQPVKMQKMHKIISNGSKLSVLSHLNSNKYVRSTMDTDGVCEERVQGQQLKDLWLDKLKDLLQDQEKIIQQERNLNALAGWRQDKKREPIRDFNPAAVLEALLPPYDTDPEYSQMPSRKDLCQQLDRLVSRNKKAPKNVDVQRLINNLIKQLQEIETSTGVRTDLSAQKKLESAEKEIQMIMGLHKEICALQSNQ